MMADPALLAALLAGIVGSAHCLGMCGGISLALGMSAREAGHGRAGAAGYVLLFGLGRVAGYSLLGALAGLAGGVLGAGDVGLVAVVARGLTGLVMVLIGLQVALHLRPLALLEGLGARVWRRLAPAARGLIPPRGPAQALLVGGLWGWLPCGLVYSMLLVALLAGDPLRSALVMAVFGLGTLPSMTAVGLLPGTAGAGLARRGPWRRAAGLLLVMLGVWTAAGPLSHLGHGGGGHEGHGGHADLKPSVASTSALMVPGSKAEWPASGTTR